MEDPEFNELNLDIEVLKQFCHLASATDSLHRAHKWYRHDQEGYQVRGREHIKIPSYLSYQFHFAAETPRRTRFS